MNEATPDALDGARSGARRPAIALPELRARYDALGPIEELTGERTFLGRCRTFEDFLDYGPALVNAWRRDRAVLARQPKVAELAELALQAWPRALP